MFLVQLAALVFGAVIGSQLPDIDLWLFFLANQHRSILTHSPLIPVGLYYAAQGRRSWWHWGGAGLAAAFAAHFASDLFPANWYGFATISIPFLGRLDGTLSLLWMMFSIVGCWYVALLLIKEPHFVVLVVLAAALSFAIGLARGRWPLPVFQPAVALVVGFCVAACLPNPVVDGATTARRWYAAAAARAARRP